MGLQRAIAQPRAARPTDILALQRGYGNRAVQRLVANEGPQARRGASAAENIHRTAADPGEDGTIQRAFLPVATNNNAHLRNDGQWGQKIGAKIPANAEIVADRADQKNQTSMMGMRTTTWTKAVNRTGEQWTQANGAATTYVRNTRLGTDKTYPQTVPADQVKPPDRKNIEDGQLNWHANSGEYVAFEDSLTTPGAKIARHKGAYRRVTPATGQVELLQGHEYFQTNTAAFENYLKDRLTERLRAATNGADWQAQFLTPANIDKVMYAKNDGSKALRFDGFGDGKTGPSYHAYYKWVTNSNGPFRRIFEGAQYVRNSLEHWRDKLLPGEPNEVPITSIKISGSDLHENGLGVMFVTFDKHKVGGHADYNAAQAYEVVVKPEERFLEQKLFGTQPTSLANTINTGVGLAGPNQLTTYKQMAETGFGTLCEKVVATQAKDLPKDVVRPITQALKESLIFVLMTGLTDLHGENVMWGPDGKPRMIDADNALKLKFMTPDQATSQKGFTFFNPNADNTFVRNVYANAPTYETEILRALRAPNTPEKQLLLSKVREMFATTEGRTVPVETATWGAKLRSFITLAEKGTMHNRVVVNNNPTKWQLAHALAAKLPTGIGDAPGLLGETGKKAGTDGNFRADREAQQIYADFTVGQIPFYTYHYGSGQVKHNGMFIWNGQPVAERMAGLFRLFPNQLDE